MRNTISSLAENRIEHVGIFFCCSGWQISICCNVLFRIFEGLLASCRLQPWISPPAVLTAWRLWSDFSLHTAPSHIFQATERCLCGRQTSVTCLRLRRGSLSVPLTWKEPSTRTGTGSDSTEPDGFPRAVTTRLCRTGAHRPAHPYQTRRKQGCGIST